MAATIINLFRKQDYTFNAAVSTTTDNILVPLVDTLNMTSGVLLWRVYSFNATNSATLALQLRNAMMGPDDPNTILVSTSDVVLQAVSAGSQLLAPALPQPIGRYLRCAARVVGSGTAGVVTVTMAADILVRDT